MATYNVTFGVKTRSGYGEPQSLAGLLSGEISGTGAADWAVTAAGSIAPSGTYGAYKTFSKAAGETYNLTVGADTVNITMAAGRADITVTAADTYSANQLKTMLTLAYNASGALVYGDDLIWRDGTIHDFQAAGTVNSTINLPTAGFGGHGTITDPGSGYISGIYQITGGSGADGQLYILASGGEVVHATLVDPGTGYQANDVVSVSGGGGAGFQYTVTNFSAELTVRSETPDPSTLADGNLRRGGGATCTALCLSVNSATPYAPIHFKYIDWLVLSGATRVMDKFLSYRSANGYGISASHNYVAVPDEVTIDSTTRILAFECRHGLMEKNYFYRVRRAFHRTSGIGCPTTSGGVTTIPVPDNTILRTRIIDNVFVNLNGDSGQLNGRKIDVEDNFGRDYIRYGTSHQDFFQHAGFKEMGGNVEDVMTMRRNVLWLGAVAGTEPQGDFLSDTRPPTTIGGVIIENEVLISATINAITVPAGLNPIIRRCTALSFSDWPGGGSGGSSTILLTYGTGGLVDQCIANAISTDKPGEEHTGADVTSRNSTPARANSYPSYLPNLAYQACTTKAQVLALCAAGADGSAKNADGTYNGALFPDGSWNDGTVYQATQPSSISQSAPASSVTVNQPIVITYQLDSAANVDVTVTPGVSGVTGSFSSATVVIATGQSSNTVTFTPTSAGTATLTATDDQSLTGPDSIQITVNAAATNPTSYTQTLNRSAVSLGSSIQITYTLDAAATSAVVITPAVSGVSGSFSAATVTIPFGQSSGSVTFFTGSVGSGTFTATDDAGLTDPAGAAFSVTASQAKKGQLLKFLRR